MGLASAIAGALRPTQSITWTREDGSAEVLTGATLTGRILDLHSNAARAIVGTLTITDGANGVFTWAYAAADVATAGVYLVQFTAAFGTGPTPARTIAASWSVEQAI